MLQLDGSGNITNRYLQGAAIDQVLADEDATSEVLWPLADNLGSIRDLVTYDDSTSTTAVANHIVYDAFGRTISETDDTVNHIFGFTGRERDEESDYQYNRARYYDAALGQFLSEDPIGFDAGDANLRRYVGNKSTFAVDPSGLHEAIGGHPSPAISTLSKQIERPDPNRIVGFTNEQLPDGSIVSVPWTATGERLRSITPYEWEQINRKKAMYQQNIRRNENSSLKPLTDEMLSASYKRELDWAFAPEQEHDDLAFGVRVDAYTRWKTMFPGIAAPYQAPRSDIQHVLRDGFGNIPGVGVLALVPNAAIHTYNGEYLEAGESAALAATELFVGWAFRSPTETVPRGFVSADEFANFGQKLQADLRGIGINDAQGILQGSSVTGVRRFSKPGIPAGTPFDAIQTSDFDVAISSRQLLQRADSLGIPLRGHGTRSKPLGPLDLEALGLQNLRGNLSQQLFKSNGRDINFIITDSTETAFSRGPSIRVPMR